MRNERHYLSNGRFSQDKGLAFYELTDFENWVGLDLNNIWNLGDELPSYGAVCEQPRSENAESRPLESFTAEVSY